MRLVRFILEHNANWYRAKYSFSLVKSALYPHFTEKKKLIWRYTQNVHIDRDKPQTDSKKTPRTYSLRRLTSVCKGKRSSKALNLTHKTPLRFNYKSVSAEILSRFKEWPGLTGWLTRAKPFNGDHPSTNLTGHFSLWFCLHITYSKFWALKPAFLRYTIAPHFALKRTFATGHVPPPDMGDYVGCFWPTRRAERAGV